MCQVSYIVGEYACNRVGLFSRLERCDVARNRGIECPRGQTDHAWVDGVLTSQDPCTECIGYGLARRSVIYRYGEARHGRRFYHHGDVRNEQQAQGDGQRPFYHHGEVRNEQQGQGNGRLQIEWPGDVGV
ncbi:hypothetical protein CTA1_11036 [Colletotrichum tanaceti]|uniref:Uncharacterized protein n=1 Tax=Colletotrichum tanaceti TaxID=1306861 RepID=A0A4U6X8U9_9PEZI|nr:hypothetical protein CTA1_11036 [Colletotrichum tanaceti]